VTFKTNGIAIMSQSGIPFMYGSGDVDTVSSNETKIVATDSSGNDADEDDEFGRSVAVGSGRIVVGSPFNDDGFNAPNSGSIYIFDLDGTLVSKISRPVGTSDSGDNFGYSVAVGSSRIVVGSPSNDFGTTQADAGSVHVYDLNGNTLDDAVFAKWRSNDYSDVDSNDKFGTSVAVGSGRIVVGAPYNDDGGTDSGSAYIHDLNGNWIAKIVASDAAAGDQFGRSVAVGSGRIVVGALLDNDTASNTGSAYIFDLDGNLIKKIVASDAAAGDQFGRSVAVGSGRIVVGALLDNDTASNTGSAYIFDLDGNLIKKIVASDAAADDYFGRSVAVGSGRIVVGSPLDNDAGASSGSAYIFDLDGNLVKKIVASDAYTGDQFGVSVAVGSGRIVVSAPYNDDAGASSGSVYVFDLDGTQLEKIVASDATGADRFGYSVAVGSGRIVAAAPFDDDTADNSGSAYIFDTPDVITPFDVKDWESGY
jgi:hypothetical protein